MNWHRMTGAPSVLDFSPIPLDGLEGWAMAGLGRFNSLGGDVVESEGGPGILWYTPEQFADFVLAVEWRVNAVEDNSGVFLRFPPLGTGRCSWRRAVTEGYEVQIDERGYDPDRKATGSPLHYTGAVYRLAPATTMASRPVGEWNAFQIAARGSEIAVTLNGVAVAHLDRDLGRPRRGHLGLQNHHPGSRVQFRSLRVKRL